MLLVGRVSAANLSGQRAAILESGETLVRPSAISTRRKSRSRNVHEDVARRNRSATLQRRNHCRVSSLTAAGRGAEAFAIELYVSIPKMADLLLNVKRTLDSALAFVGFACPT
jgi:hypothetical protein